MVRTHLAGARREGSPALFARLRRWALCDRVLPGALWACAGLFLSGTVRGGEPAPTAAARPAQAAAGAAAVPVPGSLPDILPAPGDQEEQEAAQQGALDRPLDSKDEGGKILERPLDTAAPETVPTVEVPEDFLFKVDPPLGFSGRSSILPRNDPTADFVPMEDRWRIGYPDWDRYDRGHNLADDYPYVVGSKFDPYMQNVLKGDYPILGQNTFLTLVGSAVTLVDARQTPVPAGGGFEVTTRPQREEFFGSPNQLFTLNNFSFTADLVHGDAGFKQPDWRVHVTTVLDVNTINADELAFVNPNVLAGTSRDRSFLALQEYFVETKLADTSPNFDFVSTRIGSQFFTSDFRGFLFSDTNRAVRVFGTADAQSLVWNLAYFRQAEKDTNSALNTLKDRSQNILIANVYQQDFIFPGNTVTASVTYNNDPNSRKFDTNSFRIRPDNTGVFQPHSIDAVYFGLGSDGHVDRYNLTTQLYYVTGHDTMNPIGNRSQDISAGMAAVELSYDRDWARFRTSFFWSSGDHNPNNRHATGFDTIFDNPNFAGGGFSFWQRQGIGLFGTDLKNRMSLIPDLRSSKIQGQSNFVNPGLVLLNFGADFDITPKLAMITNCNFLWFESSRVLETFLFDGNLPNRIGTDLSVGFEYRPLVSNNLQFTLGLSTLIPGSGFKALYNNKNDNIDPLVAAFFQSVLLF